MTRQRLIRVALLLFPLVTASAVSAAEPALEFIEGLRQRRYFDMALLYLDRIEKSENLPAEVRQVLNYERAQTLLESAKDLTNLDAQRKQLDASQAAFEEFVKAQPNHPLAGRANTSRGRILLEKARVDIWDGEKPSNEGSRNKYRQAARDSITQARRIFEQARDQHEKAWKAFPTYIPEEEKQQRAARDEAEGLFMEAQLDLAQCTYWDAQTYEKGDAKRKELLTKAADEFEGIHQKYRSQIGGLFARIWQGKCFEEQDEIGIALGIYEEILSHEGKSDAIRSLRDRALRFRLICLNHEKRKDSQLVVQEGEAWLQEAKARARTDVGLGIQWETCRAHEALGTDRTTADQIRRNHLNQALARARSINRFPGELKTPSSAMIQRIMVALNRDPGDPKDFDTAYGNGGQLYDEITNLKNQITKSLAEGKTKEALEHQQALKATAGEMARLYDLALKLALPDTDAAMVNIARLRLSYAYLLQQRFLDAAVVAQYQMEKYGDKFPEVGREAGFIAMSAFDNAYSSAEEGNRDFEGRMVIASAEKLAQRWPDSDRANDARNSVAKIYFQQGDMLKAAEWWEKIPVGAQQYADAQVRAGKSYWRQYVIESAKPDEERPKGEDLTKWKGLAIQRLETGLNESEKVLPDDKPLPDDLVGAKLTLVSIRNLDGAYKSPKAGVAGALELLTAEPHPVLKEVDVPKGTERPKDPSKAKSRQMASFAYQQLLRTQIGLKNLDEARKARAKLEEVAGGEDAAALTQVFVEFGRELEEELDRLKAAGETQRLGEVRSGFEAFLGDLFNRQDGQTFYSLLWIAETYTSLAEGSEDTPAKAQEFFDKASASYQSILDKAAADSTFADAAQTLACKLRLVNCLRRQRSFDKAEQVVLEILKASPNAPDAQFEAARLYQEWARSDPSNYKYFETAISGKETPTKVWGWGYTAQSLQRAIYGKKDERLEQLHFDARYHLAEAEYEFGKAHPDLKEGTKHLDRARTSITRFQRVSTRWPEDQYDRFNFLYRKILADLGNPVTDLPRQLSDSGAADGGEPVQEEVAQTGDKFVPQAAQQAEAPPATSSGSPLMMILLLLVGVGAAVGLYFLSVGQNKKKYAKYQTAGAPVKREPSDAPVPEFNFQLPDASSGGVAIAPPKIKTAGPSAKPAAPAVKPAAAKPAGTPASKPAAAPGAAAPPGTPVKKPRPAAPEGTQSVPPGQRPAAPAKPPAPGQPKPSGQVRPAGPAKPGEPGSAPPVRKPKPPEQ